MDTHPHGRGHLGLLPVAKTWQTSITDYKLSLCCHTNMSLHTYININTSGLFLCHVLEDFQEKAGTSLAPEKEKENLVDPEYQLIMHTVKKDIRILSKRTITSSKSGYTSAVLASLVAS